MGDPNSDGGAPGHPIPSKRATRQHSSCTPMQHSESPPQIQSCHRRSRPPRSAEGDAPADQHAVDGPPRDSVQGGAGQPMQESYSSSPSCSPVQYPGRARFPGRFFYEARRPLLRSMRNCSKTASGDSSRRYPHLRRFQGCAREKVGSGRRDLVKRSVTFLEFRVSGNPTSSLWQLN
jgi:hypothetical protein